MPAVADPRRPRHLPAIAAAGLAVLAQPVAADAQSPTALTISGPAVRATGAAIPVTGRGAPPGATVGLQRLRPSGWITLEAAVADAAGRVAPRLAARDEPTRQYVLPTRGRPHRPGSVRDALARVAFSNLMRQIAAARRAI